MLVTDAERNAFYRFICTHLSPNEIALICTMGDGCMECKTDIHTAFDTQEQIHEPTGKPIRVANTSRRMVNFHIFEHELLQNGLTIIKQGLTAIEPHFQQTMYAVVK